MDFGFFGDLFEEEKGTAPEPAGEGYRNVWVVAETSSGALSLPTREAMAQARELADQIGTYVYGVLVGTGVEPLAQALIECGADRVLVADQPALAEYQPERYVKALAEMAGRYRPEILLMPATPLGSDLAPRLAQRLGTGLATHCVKLGLDMSERLLLGTYAVLGGDVYHTAVCPEARPQMATLQPGAFRPAAPDPTRSGDVVAVEVEVEGVPANLTWLETFVPFELPPVPLAKARVVVSAGRGMGDAAGFGLVQKLAEAMGGTVAGSRGAFDEGWIDEEQIVGVGGHAVAPDLYVACGISGDVYHYFGIQNARYVVAINPDAGAPIMKLANLAVVGDARQVIPAMLRALGQ
jgi:electron transfer flavoprotein alpha subunit